MQVKVNMNSNLLLDQAQKMKNMCHSSDMQQDNFLRIIDCLTLALCRITSLYNGVLFTLI